MILGLVNIYNVATACTACLKASCKTDFLCTLKSGSCIFAEYSHHSVPVGEASLVFTSMMADRSCHLNSVLPPRSGKDNQNNLGKINSILITDMYFYQRSPYDFGKAPTAAL